ncbi:MAG: DUF6941 family protein, partial [Steroidobacteraceae bacterium]
MARVRVQAFLMCDTVLVDKDGKTTVQGIFDRINCDSLPTTCPSLVIFVRLRLPRPGDCNAEFEVRTPSGSTERPLQRQRMSSGDSDIAQMFHRVLAVPLREPGRHMWSL